MDTAARPPDHAPPVHFRGIALGPSGFAAQGREWLAALETAGLAPSLEAARLGELDAPLPEHQRELIDRCAARPKQPGSMVVHHMLVPHFQPDPDASANVLLTIFEAVGLPIGWARVCNLADAVVVPTEWNARVFASGGVDRAKLHFLAPPFDASTFDPTRRANRDPRQTRPTRWLSVFDWSMRKGHDLLLDAFGSVFAAEDAELWIKINPGPRLSTREIERHCTAILGKRQCGRISNLRVIDTMSSIGELAELYAQVDAFALPSRGEGWGRPVHEAMLMQLPVVTTGASALGTLVFDDTVGYPVRSKLVPVDAHAANEVSWYRGLYWYEPDAAELRARLRQVHDDPAEAERRARRAREHVLSLAEPQRLGRALREILCTLEVCAA